MWRTFVLEDIMIIVAIAVVLCAAYLLWQILEADLIDD